MKPAEIHSSGQGDYNMLKTFAKLEQEYGPTFAMWAIVAIVAYLMVHQ